MSKQLVVGYLAYDTVYSKPMIFCWTLGGLVGKILTGNHGKITDFYKDMFP